MIEKSTLQFLSNLTENNNREWMLANKKSYQKAKENLKKYVTLIEESKKAVSIPVIANGDITSGEKAKYVLDYTGADAVMIGRAAQGRPWIFREVDHYLKTGAHLAPPSLTEVRAILLEHIGRLHQFYGNHLGARIARKHVIWYLQEHDAEGAFRRDFNNLEDANQQIDRLHEYFDTLAAN